MALGERSVLLSKEGLSWSRLEDGPRAIESIAFGNGIFLGSGVDTDIPGKVYSDSQATVASTNGLDWWKVRHPLPGQGGTGMMTPFGHWGGTTAITFAGGKFVATTVHGIYISENGNTWEPTTEPNGFKSCYFGAAFGNGVFVAVGNGFAVGTNPMMKMGTMTVAVSKAGRSWELSATPPSEILYGSLSSNNVFHCYGNRRRLVTSDGEHWTMPDRSFMLGNVFGHAVAYPVPFPNEKMAVLSSTNGIVWTRLPPEKSDNPERVSSDEVPSTAKSENGIVIKLNDQSYKLNLAVNLGTPMEVQASTNLEDWVTLTVITNTGGILNFSDQDRANYPMRFYRLKLQR